MKARHIIYISSILIVFFACKKDDEFNPEYPSCKLLKEIQKISFIEEDTIYPYYEYVYEGEHLVKRILYTKFCVAGTYYSGTVTEGCALVPSVLDSFIYKNGRVYENYKNPGDPMFINQQRFFYSGNQIEKIKSVLYYRYNLKVISNTEESFEYNSDGVIIKSRIYSVSSNGDIKNVTKTYLYSGQNLSRIDIKTDFSVDTNYFNMYHYKDTTTYGFEEFNNYDSGENPYKMMFIIDELRNHSISANNYADYHLENNELHGSSITYNSKEISNHNSSGFPTRVGYLELVYECDN